MQAEELDDIVQGLAVVKYALEAGNEAAAADALDTVLAQAKALLARERGDQIVRHRPAG